MHDPHHTGRVRPRHAPGELGRDAQLAGGNPPIVRNAGFNVVKLADDALAAAREWEDREHQPARVADALERSMKIAQAADRLIVGLIDYVQGLSKLASIAGPGGGPIVDKLIRHAKAIRARVGAAIAPAFVSIAVYRRNPNIVGVPGKEAAGVISAPLIAARDAFLLFDAFVQAINDIASVFAGDMLATAKALAALIKWLKEAAQAAGRTIASAIKSMKTIAIAAAIGIGGLVVLSFAGRSRE